MAVTMQRTTQDRKSLMLLCGVALFIAAAVSVAVSSIYPHDNQDRKLRTLFAVLRCSFTV